ncbi:putative DNA-binding transcriptional regulator [Kluyvera intermedia]|uniref:YfeC-like transcriptional regulator n=1 Tax=Kluyvera intermedia TaxID=61648 RepID=UPI001F32B65C|nr:YfeC-like transcriptional regulator [Kluyvera intermedia]MCE9887725.1 putative DNA-binding transcriptional regulator [Kluyvera intermedia]
MKKLPAKMSTEELADRLGMTRQTINRWIREQGWRTEPMPGIKGGRARLIFITQQVLDYLANMPALRDVSADNQMQEPVRSYSAKESDVLWRQITDVLQNMTPVEQQRLQLLLSREGISGFLTRLGLNRDDEA